jgi:hypothetical protein
MISFLTGTVALGVLFWARKRQRDRKKVHPIVFGVAGTALVGALTMFVAGMLKPAPSITAADRDRLFAAHGYAAGKKIAEKYKEGDVVVLIPDSEMETSRGVKLLDAVKTALGKV